jgi:Na+/melibiose symporter-like transporter
MFGTFFLVSQYFQLVLGYTALQTGLFQLPMAFVMMGLSPQVPRLVGRFGVARVVPMGLSLVATGLLLFSFMGVDTTIWWVYGPILCLAGGMALTMSPLTTLIMSAVPVTKAGVGSAMNDTTRELGGALGVAMLGSLVTSTYASSMGDAIAGLPGPQRAMAESGLVGAFNVASQLGTGGNAVIEAAKQAFVDGIGVAAITGAVVVAIAAVVSARLLPRGAELSAPPATSAPDVVLEDQFALAD